MSIQTIKTFGRRIRKILFSKTPTFLILYQLFLRYFPVGSLAHKLSYDAVSKKPQYAFCMYNAARQALALGYTSITVIEFGVFKGKGLSEMEKIASMIENEMGISIFTVGFDNASGLPNLEGYKDLSHRWSDALFEMGDPNEAKKIAPKSELILGNVKNTVTDLCNKKTLPPVAAAMFDLDLYSSTRDALSLFDVLDESLKLPRIYCYFDDIIESGEWATCEHVGEALAINEFNSNHPTIKICKLPSLYATRYVPAPWNEQIYVCHDFNHPKYSENIRDELRHIPNMGYIGSENNMVEY